MQHRPNEQWGREHERSGRGAPRGDGRRDRNARPEQHQTRSYEERDVARHAADDSYERESEAQRYGDDPFDRAYGRPAFDGDRDRGDFGSYGSDRQRRDRLERDPQGWRFGMAAPLRRCDWRQPNYGGAGYYGGEGLAGRLGRRWRWFRSGRQAGPLPGQGSEGATSAQTIA
jgi:hypothetical protein